MARPNVNPAALFREAAQKRCLDIAEMVVAEARVKAPQGKTGKLAGGYLARRSGRGAEIANPAAPYWAHVEYGHAIADEEGNLVERSTRKAGDPHYRVRAYPHVRPAIEIIRTKLSGTGGDE